MTSEQEEDTWLELAELFFLDTEPEENVYPFVAQRLKERGLSREQVKTILKEEVAPIAGSNLGYLLWPVIGNWSGFDRDDICSKIRAHVNCRRKQPKWFYLLQDMWSENMLQMLDVEKLLALL